MSSQLYDARPPSVSPFPGSPKIARPPTAVPAGSVTAKPCGCYVLASMCAIVTLLSVTKSSTLDASLRAAVQVCCIVHCWVVVAPRMSASLCITKLEWKTMRRAFADADKGHRSVLGREEFAAVRTR